MRSAQRSPLLKSQRSRAALLALGLLVPLACAQGVQDTPTGDDGLDTGGDQGSAGARAGSSAAGRAGGSAAAGAPAGGATGGTTGGAGKGGTSASAAGKGGSSASGTGGSVGKGGSTSAGAGGKGGSASGGASAGSANGGSTSAGATGSGGAAVAGFSVQYKNEHPQASSAYIGGEILVHNAGPSSLGVSGLKVRYYFTDEPKVAPKFMNNFQHINTSGTQFNLTVTMQNVGMAPTAAMADTFIEFSFAASEHSALGPNEDLDFAWQMQGQDPAKDTYNQANDYSYDISKTSLTNWEHIVLLQGTNVLWGSPP